MTDGRDIMTRFPVEVSSQILSVLDARSLVACSRVNEGWDEITKNVDPEIWFRACVEANILVSSDKYNNTTDWKAFLSSMMKRWDDMQTSASFGTGRTFVKLPLKAIYYHNGKFALAFHNKIEVWNSGRLYRCYKCGFETTFLKIDDTILLSGTRDGILLLWSLPSGILLRNYSDRGEIPTSFDFLTEYDIIVKSFFNKSSFLTGVSIRTMSDNKVVKKLILKPQSLIIRVSLAPHPEYPVTDQQKKCYLFALTLDYICVFIITLHSSTISHSILSTLKFNIPFDLRTSNDIVFKPPGGLLFDGRNVYIMSPSLPAANFGMIRWDIKENNLSCIQDNGIISLLGVGQMYLAFELKTEENAGCILITHKISQEVVATINLPGRYWLADDSLCLGETSWLDGLNGENDSGIVCAFIAEDRLSFTYLKFFPRCQ